MRSRAQRALAWHPPLMLLAGLMAACAAVSLVGLWLDPKTILGAPAWAKPLRFSVSILLYAVTWAWLIAQLPRWRALARRLGTVIAVTLLIEQILILAAAATGTTSHFNVSNGFHAAVWAVMAVSITVMYLCSFITSVALFALQLSTPALTLAVRAGALIALGGIGIAFLMTAPTASQLSTPTGIIGAHTVGVADGGPGLPILGWSTVGGDWRVAHFVGMHALQMVPITALLLAAAGRRIDRLRPATTQFRLVIVIAAAYAGATALLAWQAGSGQSVAHPAGAVLVTACVLGVATAAIAVIIIAFPPRTHLLSTHSAAVSTHPAPSLGDGASDRARG